MKRPTVPKGGAKGGWTCADGAFAARYPTLAELCCDPWWDDGKPRELSSLAIRFGGDGVTVSCCDHATQRSAYTTAPDLQTALDLLEEALQAGKPVWRPWKVKGR